MTKRYTYISFILLLLGLSTAAQGQTYTASGYVIDDSTGAPLPFIAVRQVGTGNGVLTDSLGKFALPVKGNSAHLQARMLGYAETTVKIYRTNSKSITIRMKETPLQLSPVEITDRKVQLVHHNKQLYMYDYEFIDDLLLLVVHDRELKRSKLVLINDQDSIISEAAGLTPPGRLERDCLGNVYAISQSQAAEIEIESGLLTATPYPIEAYDTYVKPCIGYLDSTVYLETWHNNQYKEFFYQPHGSGPAYSLRIMADRERMMQMAEEGFPLDKKTSPADILRSSASDSPAVMFELFFLQKTFFAPIYSPLFIVDEHALVFDHTNGELLKFAFPNTPPRSTPIDYHTEKRWQKEIYVDKERAEAYTVFLRNGITTLKEIDLLTGKLTGEWPIPKAFISKIQIKNGMAYFMYKDKIYDDVNRLYRLQLK